MIPVLFDRYETSFTSNGIGRLAECVSFVVTEERNGIYEAEFEYPVTGRFYPFIEHGSIVYATHDDTGNPQPFVVYAHSAAINGIVTFYAHHISYRLNDVVVEPFTAASCTEAIQGVKNNSVNDNDFTFWTDKTTAGDFVLTVPKEARNILGGEEGSLLDVYGGGDYEFDHFNVKLYADRGSDTQVEIRYGKNLIDFNEEVDSSSLFDAVVPYWQGTAEDAITGEEEEIVVMLPEKIVASGVDLLANQSLEIIQNLSGVDIEVDGEKLRAVPLDLTSIFEEQPTAAQLRAAALSALHNAKGWQPLENLKVDFVQLWQTEEYADFAPLQRVRLCDRVSVYFPQMGIVKVKQKVIKTVYNVLVDRYDSIELGELQTSLTQEIRDSLDLEQYATRDSYFKLQADLTNMVSDLETQMDGKIQTWYQSTDPSLSWSATEKPDHNGDLWCYTGTTTSTRINQAIYRYTYDSQTQTEAWTEYDASKDLFDEIDTKTTIFYGTPSGTYTGVEVGDYLVDSTDGCTYRWNGSQWVKLTDYNSAITSLQTVLEAQIDSKIETFYQSADPSTSWDATAKAAHKGDLWFKTTDGKTYQWSGSAWQEMTADPPTSVFNTINGKANIFVGSTTPANPQEGDLWFKAASQPILTYVSGSWQEYNKYTDDSSLTTFISTTYANNLTSLQTQIDGKIQTWYQSTNPALSWSADEKPNHNGDLWCYTGQTQTTYPNLIHLGTYRYEYVDAQHEAWTQFDATEELFDEVDSKTTIFYGTTSGTYTGVETGDYLVDSTDGCTYRWSGSAWVKQTDYASAISSMQSTLNAAITNATQKITGAQGGYVYLKPNANGYPQEILIMNTQDYTTATKIWRWNINGLGYSSTGYNGTFGTAITMDGAIVADYITTGTLNANLIKAGTLQDANGNTSLDMSTGTLTFKKGSINLGSGAFTVSTAGAMTCTNATITGGSLNINNRFTVDTAGRMYAYSAQLGTYATVDDTGLNVARTISSVPFSALYNYDQVYIEKGTGSSYHYSQITADEMRKDDRFLVDNSGAWLGGVDTTDVCFMSDGTDLYTYVGSTVATTKPNLRLTPEKKLRETSHTNSSRKIKEDITTDFCPEVDPARLYDVEVVQFKYGEKSRVDPNDERYKKDLPGFIVEDLDKVYPVAVDKDGSEDSISWSWNDAYLIPPMLKLIQEQHKEIEELRTELDDIKERIAAIEKERKM